SIISVLPLNSSTFFSLTKNKSLPEGPERKNNVTEEKIQVENNPLPKNNTKKNTIQNDFSDESSKKKLPMPLRKKNKDEKESPKKTSNNSSEGKNFIRGTIQDKINSKMLIHWKNNTCYITSAIIECCMSNNLKRVLWTVAHDETLDKDDNIKIMAKYMFAAVSKLQTGVGLVSDDVQKIRKIYKLHTVNDENDTFFDVADKVINLILGKYDEKGKDIGIVFKSYSIYMFSVNEKKVEEFKGNTEIILNINIKNEEESSETSDSFIDLFIEALEVKPIFRQTIDYISKSKIKELNSNDEVVEKLKNYDLLKSPGTIDRKKYKDVFLIKFSNPNPKISDEIGKNMQSNILKNSQSHLYSNYRKIANLPNELVVQINPGGLKEDKVEQDFSELTILRTIPRSIEIKKEYFINELKDNVRYELVSFNDYNGGHYIPVALQKDDDFFEFNMFNTTKFPNEIKGEIKIEEKTIRSQHHINYAIYRRIENK
ncbi:hypothetical protein ACFLZV_02395, partial [Candidatus Margulisiibacteriota bacterium]